MKAVNLRKRFFVLGLCVLSLIMLAVSDASAETRWVTDGSGTDIFGVKIDPWPAETGKTDQNGDSYTEVTCGTTQSAELVININGTATSVYRFQADDLSPSIFKFWNDGRFAGHVSSVSPLDGLPVDIPVSTGYYDIAYATGQEISNMFDNYGISFNLDWSHRYLYADINTSISLDMSGMAEVYYDGGQNLLLADLDGYNYYIGGDGMQEATGFLPLSAYVRGVGFSKNKNFEYEFGSYDEKELIMPDITNTLHKANYYLEGGMQFFQEVADGRGEFFIDVRAVNDTVALVMDGELDLEMPLLGDSVKARITIGDALAGVYVDSDTTRVGFKQSADNPPSIYEVISEQDLASGFMKDIVDYIAASQDVKVQTHGYVEVNNSNRNITDFLFGISTTTFYIQGVGVTPHLMEFSDEGMALDADLDLGSIGVVGAEGTITNDRCDLNLKGSIKVAGVKLAKSKVSLCSIADGAIDIAGSIFVDGKEVFMKGRAAITDGGQTVLRAVDELGNEIDESIKIAGQTVEKGLELTEDGLKLAGDQTNDVLNLIGNISIPLGNFSFTSVLNPGKKELTEPRNLRNESVLENFDFQENFFNKYRHADLVDMHPDSFSPERIDAEGPRYARYVKYTMDATEYLAVQEIQVWSDGVNVALNKEVLMSSLYRNRAAGRAVDGAIPDTVNGVAMTDQDTNPYIMVDLGATYYINEVDIYRRTDCCMPLYNNEKVFLISEETSIPVAFFNENLTQKSIINVPYAGGDIAVVNVIMNNPLCAIAEFDLLEDGKTDRLDLSQISYYDAFEHGAYPSYSGINENFFIHDEANSYNGSATVHPEYTIDSDRSTYLLNADRASFRVLKNDHNGQFIPVNPDALLFFTNMESFDSYSVEIGKESVRVRIYNHPNGLRSVNTAVDSKTGRYVDVYLKDTTTYLGLAEVKVFDENTNRLTGTASQSSTHESFDASRANDQNDDSLSHNGSVSLTKEEYEPTWTLDLGENKYIDHVDIIARGNSSVLERNRNIAVRIRQDLAPIYQDTPNSEPVGYLASDANNKGRYLKFWLPHENESLMVAEIEAFDINGRNVALGKPATQTSVWAGHTADRAVDGNTAGTSDDYDVTIAQTRKAYEPWIQVDLLENRKIAYVVLHNYDDRPDRLPINGVLIPGPGSVIHQSSHLSEEEADRGKARIYGSYNTTQSYRKIFSGVVKFEGDIEWGLDIDANTWTGKWSARGSVYVKNANRAWTKAGRKKFTGTIGTDGKISFKTHGKKFNIDLW